MSYLPYFPNELLNSLEKGGIEARKSSGFESERRTRFPSFRESESKSDDVVSSPRPEPISICVNPRVPDAFAVIRNRLSFHSLENLIDAAQNLISEIVQTSASSSTARPSETTQKKIQVQQTQSVHEGTDKARAPHRNERKLNTYRAPNPRHSFIMTNEGPAANFFE